MSDTAGFGYGQIGPDDFSNDMAVTAAIVRQMVAQLDIMKLVQVVAVHGGGVAVAGTVDVVPLVNQVDGEFNAVPHGTVYGIPWSRVQGGTSAVICDPVANDIGWVSCADRDGSSVATRNGMLNGSSLLSTGINPGSRRKYHVSDGVYAGGCLNVAPSQYLIFTATGVRLVDKNGNSITMGPTGVIISDGNGNEIITGAGFVNIVTASFQVNGTPVTVP